jgi:hypothetical protein
MQESKWNKLKDERLCPIVFYLPGGWLTVMIKCRELTRKEFLTFDRNIFYPYPEDISRFNIPVEDKEDSFGWYRNKIVAVDYGSWHDLFKAK